MQPEIMIDIETLAVPERLPKGFLVEVVEIGAVKFGPHGIEDEMEILFPRPGNGLCEALTVQFWMTRPTVPSWLDARVSAGKPERMPDMRQCLEKLTRFIGGYKAVVWSKGAFDLRILREHYTANHMGCPWQYYNERDLRTVMKEAGVARPYEQVSHNALDDCIQQVGSLLRCRAAFGGNKDIQDKQDADADWKRFQQEVQV